MATQFTREERVMFDNFIEGFDDLLIAGKTADLYTPPSGQDMVRYGDKFWLEAPMIGASYNGFDQTANFDGLTELAVPVNIGFHKVVPKTLSAKDMRNEYALSKFSKAAQLKLASDVNLAAMSTACVWGSNFVKRTNAAGGFDDIAEADSRLTETGVTQAERYALLSARDYNGMASNLAKPQTSGLDKTATAYEKAYLGNVAGFETFKNDQSFRLAAASGGATTVDGANQYYTPKATTTAATGETENHDNRSMPLKVTAATYANVKVGDSFTIAGVNSVHMISKEDTGQLQTFRVVGKPAPDTLQIIPPIISGGGGSIAEKEYQNVTATPANGAVITWLNTANAVLNPFFIKSSLIIVPGSYAVDPKDGWSVMQASTDLGINVTYTRQGDINDLSVKARWDIDFGTAYTNPQTGGVIAFNQV